MMLHARKKLKSSNVPRVSKTNKKKHFCREQTQLRGIFQVFKLVTEYRKLIKKKHFCIEQTQLLGKFQVF